MISSILIPVEEALRMFYRISKQFGSQDEAWKEYIEWAGLQNCQGMYSIDGTIREGLFVPESVGDWENCVNADYRNHLITNLAFARNIISRYSDAEILGIVENPKISQETIPPDHVLMGYDLIDEYNDVSLLTNWGGRAAGIKGLKCNRFALIDDIEYAYDLKEMLHRDFPGDEHARACEVWSVYKVSAS